MRRFLHWVNELPNDTREDRLRWWKKHARLGAFFMLVAAYLCYDSIMHGRKVMLVIQFVLLVVQSHNVTRCVAQIRRLNGDGPE